MKFTLSWLKEHLATDVTIEEIGITLTRIGLEVESIEDRAADLSAFKVAYVKSAARHPNADKLQVCQVETAEGDVEVVCGAPNARAGIKVVFAPVGSVIPASGLELKAGAIRGVVSNGMLCSARELMLGEDHDGIIELPESAVVGQPLADVLGLNDPVIDIAITPNRGDCNGVAGVARDLAAAGIGHVVTGEIAAVPGSFESPIRTHVATPAAPLFEGRYIRGVKNTPSPAWVQNRLRAVGLRPISALVDVTNLISLDRARPLHVFDAAKLTGDLTARLAKPGETLSALDGKTYALDETMIVIADQVAARAIAGVMGGEETGCTEATTDVFIEAALFDPVAVATAGRKLGINSDARYRFERGVDPQFNRAGLELATALILEWCGGGEASHVVTAGVAPNGRRTIAFDPALVTKLTGLEISTADVLRLIGDIGCTITGAMPFMVTTPSWRPDLHGAADLVEEVTRLYGLDNIPSTPLPRLNAVTKPGLDAGQRRAREARRALAGRGLIEAVTNSFVPREHAALFGGGAEDMLLANPISADLDAMRPSVLPSLIAAAARNAARGLSPAHLFEVGPAFAGAGESEQPYVATGLRSGTPPRQWTGAAPVPDAFMAKADALSLIEALGGPTANLSVWTDAPGWYHPGRSGQLKLGPKTVVARFGELHPKVLERMDLKGPTAAFEVFLDAIPLPKTKATKTKPALALSDYPAVERDFAFVVKDSVAAADVVKAASGADKALIESVQVFDVYAGKGVPEGSKSLAIAVRLSPRDRTLTEAEIEAVGAKIVVAVTKATGGALRT